MITSSSQLYNVISNGNTYIKLKNKAGVQAAVAEINLFKSEPYDLFNRKFLGFGADNYSSVCSSAVPLQNSLQLFEKRAVEFLKLNT